jgi:hypothetical protein
MAMTNLHMASGQNKTQLSAGTSMSKGMVKGPRSANSSIQEYCNFKRKGSTVNENCRPSKFISLAQAVSRFQANIPDRFHSRPKTDNQRSRKGITVQKLTISHSPNSRSHLRSRPVHYLTREEEKEAEEMKAMRVKANALNPKIFEPPTLGIRVERKPPRVPVPFNLTEIVRNKSTAPPVFVFTAKPAPKAILGAPQGIPKKKQLQLTVPVSPACLKKSKVYANVLDLEDEARKIQEAAQFKARPFDVIHKKPFEPKIQNVRLLK